MTTVPEKLREAIDWVGVRLPVWTTQGAAIGLDADQLDALAARHASAEALKAEYDALKAQASAKGAEYRLEAGAMRSMASGLVTQIRGFARTTASAAEVLARAQLPRPADPSPSEAPGTPEGFRVELLQSGSLRFGFACEHPAGVKGVTYKVMRQDGPGAPFAFLLNAKGRRFRDDSLASGSAAATYMVTAQTTTKDGNPAYFTVRFGSGNQASIIAQGPVGETDAA